MSKDKNEAEFIDDPHAPEVFADAATGFFHFNGNIRTTFESLRVDHSTAPGPVHRVVIGRLNMPVSAAEAFARGLLDFIETQRAANSAPQANATIQ
ncbi:hypothetical protein [Rhizobium leguminosarum]|uniref:hypothetical protein n=1 Tax=Rhizobium leguminosarum TaxID=384 RepID=UPI00098FBB38|nr:hypothetical protein [Rhizobium leguminosarum]MBB5261788.1 hypothetical protein [Rhizobium leguminosarum]MBY5485404.1 hypothetical protein [Rhizobium leguminosarum]MDX6000572.1 hypothetical protein [Rhizobium leguminosarum]OOO44744.1 hypothetical protein BS629_26305 [Rhizobium leguminosarum bv. viciae USDA 2370]PUB64915.1 hypothetical protein DB728_09415 [Rhizobium leguminosarum bv. viciae USDA 2370]